MLTGVVNNHHAECLNPECPLLCPDQELYHPLSDAKADRKIPFHKEPIVLYHLIHSIYAEYAKNSNATCILHTTYSYYLNFQIGNYHMALQELNSAEKCEATF
jgi:hypothetical protein